MDTLDDNQFKSLFYETMEAFANIETVYSTYIIRSFTQETDWKGIDLTKIRIQATNYYDCWLKLDNIFKENNVPYYDRQFIEEVGCEECEDLEIPHTMENYVVAFIKLFVESDSLWPIKTVKKVLKSK